MSRAFRPKSYQRLRAAVFLLARGGGALVFAVAGSGAAWGQVPIASSYSTRDGRIVSYTMACVSMDGSFTAQPCGVAGYPVHVMLEPGGAAPSLPSGAATAALQPALAPDGGAQVHIQNFPTLMPVSAAALPLPAGAATAALQPALAADGGAQVHIQNLPATQVVSNAGTFAVQDAALITSTASLVTNTAARSGAWTDASLTATATAATPTALAAVAGRVGLHVWNVGSATACLNYTGVAAVSGSGCAAGSVPIPAGSAYLEDQPGNVSPEAISLVCAGASCPLTIKVR